MTRWWKKRCILKPCNGPTTGKTNDKSKQQINMPSNALHTNTQYRRWSNRNNNSNNTKSKIRKNISYHFLLYYNRQKITFMIFKQTPRYSHHHLIIMIAFLNISTFFCYCLQLFRCSTPHISK